VEKGERDAEAGDARGFVGAEVVASGKKKKKTSLEKERRDGSKRASEGKEVHL